MIGITRGHAVFPLDDSYIHFQYARRLAQGIYSNIPTAAVFQPAPQVFFTPSFYRLFLSSASKALPSYPSPLPSASFAFA